MPKEANSTNGHRPSVHVVLQAKGGVGKSFVAAILAQYSGYSLPLIFGNQK